MLDTSLEFLSILFLFSLIGNRESFQYCSSFIHIQYCDAMRFTALHNRHHKVLQSVPFFMHCKTVTILLRIRVRAHFAMSITKNHESHYVTVLNNPQFLSRLRSIHYSHHSSTHASLQRYCLSSIMPKY